MAALRHRTSRRAHGTAWLRAPLAAALLAVMVVVAAVAGPTAATTLPQFTDVAVTSDINYTQTVTWDGVTTDLALDLYEGVGDTRARRPLLLWIHGGSFAFGDKTDSIDVSVATDLAKRGFVTASMNYRLGPEVAEGGIGGIEGDPELIGAILRAMNDARAAVLFLRQHADDYRIDPDRIFIGGASAGAVTSLNVGYLYNNEGGSNGPDDPYRVAGVISIAGTTLAMFPQPSEPALFMAHGTDDETVPYSEALALCDAARAATVACEFRSYPTDHLGLADYFDEIMAEAEPWLLARLGELDAEVARRGTADTPTTSASTTSAVPPLNATTVAPTFTG